MVVFVDTDVILDFLIDRTPYSIKSSEIFALAESGKIKVYVSSLCFSNLYYVCRKLIGREKTLIALQKLEKLTHILPVTQMTVRQSLHSAFKDFEDSIQYHSAIQEKDISTIITRNIKDFQLSELTVQTPEEFISQYLKKEVISTSLLPPTQNP